MTSRTGPGRVLFVCTANICRSPTAELIARQRFGESNLMFRSAGFLSVAATCPDELIEVLGARQIDATSHQSYVLDEASIKAADLLLTMEGSHVQKGTMLAPDAFPKIIPLKQAAALVQQVPHPGRSIEELIVELNTDRDPREYLGNRWDVDDPYGGRVKAYRKAVEEIDHLVTTVIGSLH